MKHMFKRRFAVLLLCALLGVCLCGTAAEAAVQKKLRLCHFTTSTAEAGRSALSVVPGKTYTVKLPANSGETLSYGYLKMKVPSTRQYTFTLSGLKSSKAASYGFAYVQTPREAQTDLLELREVNTYGGVTNGLYLGTKKSKAGDEASRWFLKKRAGRLRLKAGNTVYLYFCFTPSDSLTLKIS